MPASPKFKRKNIRLPAGRYSGPGAYFITLCFHNRHRFGANPRLVAWLVEQLRKHADACGFHIHAYCVMPDHLHVLAAACSKESNLIKFVESFKQETALELRVERIVVCGNSNITIASCAVPMVSIALHVTSG